jgi:hypothetical protein
LHFTDGFLYWESLQSTKAEDGEVLGTKPRYSAKPYHGKLWAHQAKGLASLENAESLDEATIWSWNGKFRFCLSDMPELSRVLYRTIQGPQQSSVFDRMVVPFDYSRRASGQNAETEQWSPLDWFKVIEFYSTTSITHSKDRLIAISGLARHIHRRIGVPYYCGLWADRFLIQLLWFRGGPCFDWPAESRAPSWSWASVDGEILYPLDIGKLSVDSSIRVLGLAAEPLVRGSAISRTS